MFVCGGNLAEPGIGGDKAVFEQFQKSLVVLCQRVSKHGTTCSGKVVAPALRCDRSSGKLHSDIGSRPGLILDTGQPKAMTVALLPLLIASITLRRSLLNPSQELTFRGMPGLVVRQFVLHRESHAVAAHPAMASERTPMLVLDPPSQSEPEVGWKTVYEMNT